MYLTVIERVMARQKTAGQIMGGGGRLINSLHTR